MIENGKKVSVNYIGTLQDGTEFDNSYNSGRPLEFTIGDGQMISGFDRSVSQMQVGERIKILLSPEEAYGFVEPTGFLGVRKNQFADDMDIQVGGIVEGTDDNGNPVAALVHQVIDDVYILNMNHPLAGKTLNFEIELLSAE